MNKIDNIDKFAARVLMVSFFIPGRLQVFITAAACFYFVFRTIGTKKWSPRSNYLWALFLGSGFLIYLLAVPFTPHEYRKELLHICERMEALLLMPLVFAIIGNSFRSLIVGELIYFVYGCFVSCMVANADFICHYLRSDSGTHPLSHVLYRMYFEAVCGIHPTYMSMYICFSVCILLGTSVFNVRGGNIIKYLLLYSMLVLLLSLLAKSPLLAIIIILIHASWLNRKTIGQYKTLIVGGLFAVIASGFAVPFFRQRMLEIVHFVQGGNGSATADNSLGERTLIFNTDMDMLRHYWLTGVGPGRVLTMLRERYFFHSITSQRFVGYFDPHNQYFAVWLSFGILGLGLFVGIIATHFIKAIKTQNYLYLYLLIILAVTFITESVLYRQQGVVFYAVFTSLFFYSRYQKDKPLLY
ncbi:MAG: hypothetical protein JWQ38_447 [Flavipsychrobacter sp.]|nr:hypothetical protein [Flavipsychrobacter sp.]